MQAPNILWINCHDISPDLGCYDGVCPGAEYASTPKLDRLAAEGARYDRAFAPSPVCAPSRSSVITGMFPTAIGTMHMRSHAVPPPEARCFPEYLRAAGYYCTNNYFTDYQFQTPVSVWDDCSVNAHWRNRPDPAQPFFAVFCGHMAHESQIAGTDAEHAERTARLSPEQRHDPAAAPVPPYQPDTPAIREAWARYSDNVSALDAWAGDLLAELEEDGLAEDTLVVFWSDHGRGLPRGKRWPYDAGLRVPVLVRWPGVVAPGTVRTELVYLMDLAATVLAVAGLPVPEHMHARPLFDSDGRFADGRTVVFGHRDRIDETEDTMRTARDARFRYIRNYHPERPYAQHSDYAESLPTWRELRRLRLDETMLLGRGVEPELLGTVPRRFLAATKPEEELYDTRTDPHEVENLAADPRYATDLNRLRAALSDWQETYGDLGLIPERELIERWRPGGVMRVTDSPIVTFDRGKLTATCATKGASIAWTSDPPPEAATDAAGQEAAWLGQLLTAAGHGDVAWVVKLVGGPETGERHWQLYSEPVDPAAASSLWFRAQRLGFRASADVEVPASANAGAVQ
jgi:N-sulfoglucosamine sulfohydrolase